MNEITNLTKKQKKFQSENIMKCFPISFCLTFIKSQEQVTIIPQILSANENNFDRKTRFTLTQLISGHSTHFNSYHHRLKYNLPDVCRSYHEGPHTTDHLFNCRENPTARTIESLWENPEEAVNHQQLITLSLVTSFCSFSPLTKISQLEPGKEFHSVFRSPNNLVTRTSINDNQISLLSVLFRERHRHHHKDAIIGKGGSHSMSVLPQETLGELQW